MLEVKLYVALLLALWLGSLGIADGLWWSSERKAAPMVAVSLTPDVLKDNMEFWTKDYAVMFYSTWCPHCRQFAPAWDRVAQDMSPKGKKHRPLVVGKLDCEASEESIRFCHEVGVTHYPSLFTFGYGNYHDHDWITGMFLKRSTHHDTVAKYNGLIYYEAVRDWVKTMAGISGYYRLEDRIKGWFGLGSGRQRDATAVVDHLRDENRALKRRNAELEYGGGTGTGAGAGSSSAAGGGVTSFDPFVEMASANWDESYLPLLACIVDRSEEYCNLVTNEPFCDLLAGCVDTGFSSMECRPQSCPFGPIGCEHVATCLEVGCGNPDNSLTCAVLLPHVIDSPCPRLQIESLDAYIAAYAGAAQPEGE
ncbi:unnamed protein product, partial [Chrysoparadoxa australica]